MEKLRPEQSPENKKFIEDRKTQILESRDIQKGGASELQKSVAEIQAAKYETTLYRLMDRTKDNPELVNNLNALLDGLDHQSRFGNSSESIGPARQEDLSKFLGEVAKALRWSVGGGNRPADVQVDLNKWNLNK